MIQLLIINDPSYKEGPQIVNGIEYNVRLADAPLKALNEIIHVSPDAIILNTENSGMDARNLFTRIRNMQASRRVPVLLFCELDHENDLKPLCEENVTELYTMPVTQYEAFGWVAKKIGAEKPAQQKNIVIVDDDPVVLDLCKLYLGAKYRVSVFDNADAALEKLISFTPDIILLDIAMPGKDGMTLFTEIRQIPTCHEVPIVFQTGMAGVKTVRECVKLGAAGFVIKPVQKKALLDKIDEIFRATVKKQQRKRIYLFEEFDFMYQLIVGYLKEDYQIVKGEAVTAISHLEDVDPKYVMIDIDNSSYILGKMHEKANKMKLPMILLTKNPESDLARKEKQIRNTFIIGTPLKKDNLLDVLGDIKEWK